MVISTSRREESDVLYDSSLPALWTALDTATMGGIFEQLPSFVTPAGSRLTVTSAKLLDYKRDKRGLIRYEIAGAQATSLFGKLYADQSRAIQVYETMKLLADKVFGGHARLGLPYPVWCIPELSMLVYVPVEGRFLAEMFDDDAALPLLAVAGDWLATLHRSTLSLPRQLHMATEVVNVQRWAALVGRRYPDEAEATGHIAGYLRERAEVLRFQTDVPIHKDFHYGHVIVNRKLQVIDFDEMRLGDPNFDLGHFCANLYLLTCRQPDMPRSFTALRDSFLDAYAALTGWSADERLDYFFTYTCLKIAWQISNGYGPHPRPEGKERHRQLRQVLRQGLEAASLNPPTPLIGVSTPPTVLFNPVGSAA